jgi:hypothetical protein
MRSRSVSGGASHPLPRTCRVNCGCCLYKVRAPNYTGRGGRLSESAQSVLLQCFSVQPSCVHDRERSQDSNMIIPTHFARILAHYLRLRQVLSRGLRQVHTSRSSATLSEKLVAGDLSSLSAQLSDSKIDHCVVQIALILRQSVIPACTKNVNIFSCIAPASCVPDWPLHGSRPPRKCNCAKNTTICTTRTHAHTVTHSHTHSLSSP